MPVVLLQRAEGGRQQHVIIDSVALDAVRFHALAERGTAGAARDRENGERHGIRPRREMVVTRRREQFHDDGRPVQRNRRLGGTVRRG